MFCKISKTSLHGRPLRLAFRNAKTKSGNAYKSHKVKLDEYLDEIDAFNLKNLLPPKLLKFSKFSEQLYLINDSVAEHLAETIVKNLDDRNLVMESNPGLGLLTKRLLENGVHRVNLYESDLHFLPHLQALKENHNENIMLYKNNLLESMKLKFQDRMDGGSREKDIIQSFPKRSWVEEPPVAIIGTLSSTSFIRYLLISLFLQNGLMVHCRPDLFLIVPRLTQNGLTSKGSKYYRPLYLMFNMAFKVTTLTKVPRTSFLPWEQKSKKTSGKGEDTNPQEMYLIRATGRPDFYEKVVSAEKIRELWFFISTCFVNSKFFVIPTLEKYIPNCGPRLIYNNNITIYTRFRDLSIEEILIIFKQFTSWPEYSISVFSECVHTLFMKTNVTLDEMERHLSQQSNENEEENEQENSIIDTLKAEN